MNGAHAKYRIRYRPPTDPSAATYLSLILLGKGLWPRGAISATNVLGLISPLSQTGGPPTSPLSQREKASN